MLFVFSNHSPLVKAKRYTRLRVNEINKLTVEYHERIENDKRNE